MQYLGGIAFCTLRAEVQKPSGAWGKGHRKEDIASFFFFLVSP